mmetsp:Transcript_20797/g.37040  ORF Transcript_20797/g.37040 Transcript_20797/m.37040 type:complete len:152 (+) Transcript_20797:137-592(+)|eukprot:CAMPEP_0197529338 /NCGR_PEP_ID=MMETSP1318-20131121/28082_1 /TAXON_ID=552666 /ORGANISM="Partenskyella glossopodia, Strain RCC365" /LENGTH=151 /DNA_ID=CAMNT_0043084765 /DNA_START=127 /DNA_END=582 /DNA_ORIENTATION=-
MISDVDVAGGGVCFSSSSRSSSRTSSRESSMNSSRGLQSPGTLGYGSPTALQRFRQMLSESELEILDSLRSKAVFSTVKLALKGGVAGARLSGGGTTEKTSALTKSTSFYSSLQERSARIRSVDVEGNGGNVQVLLSEPPSESLNLGFYAQ